MASHAHIDIEESDDSAALVEGKAARAPGTHLPTIDARAALVQRVLASSTFQHCPKLRAFLDYVCRCGLKNDPSSATEQLIGIHVFGRSPGYNANQDNIVRSQARLLRLKLEHHFANEGRHEPVVITIPKGRYLPAWEPRPERDRMEKADAPVQATEETEPAEKVPAAAAVASPGKAFPAEEEVPDKTRNYWPYVSALLAGLLAGLVTWVAAARLRPTLWAASGTRLAESRNPAANVTDRGTTAAAAYGGEDIRIAAGNNTGAYVDPAGHRWDSDKFYEGGVSEAGPRELFPPVSDAEVFRSVREGALLAAHAPGGFQYNIPAGPGSYELRLYFADPMRRAIEGSDGQHLRHFQVNLNGNPILTNFDAVADAGSAAVDIRTFRDVSPSPDGKIHLEFVPAPDRPFVSAIELSPGEPGKLEPIRLSVRSTDFVDGQGTRWSADEYYVNGTTLSYASPENASRIPGLYTAERFGNFTYAIPVPDGSYTVRLHFLESFFGPSSPSGLCWGAGCRIFDVTCNGESLLKDFDIFQAAGGEYRPVIRAFHGLHPNGQGKLLLSFSPRVDYAEVRAIEVIDDGEGVGRR